MRQLLHNPDVFAELYVLIDSSLCSWIETRNYKAVPKQVVVDCDVLCAWVHVSVSTCHFVRFFSWFSSTLNYPVLRHWIFIMCYKSTGKSRKSMSRVLNKTRCWKQFKTPKNNSSEYRNNINESFLLQCLLWEKRGCRSYSAWCTDLPSWSARAEKPIVGMERKKISGSVYFCCDRDPCYVLPYCSLKWAPSPPRCFWDVTKVFLKNTGLIQSKTYRLL